VDIPDPLLGNGSVNTFPLLGSRFLTMQHLDFKNGEMFSTWSVTRCYKQGTRLDPVQLLRRWPDENGVIAEAEESPILEAVTRKRLVKTLQAAEDLVFAALICNVWD
jgi:hypothetical protein